jgi:hypothetical protein
MPPKVTITGENLWLKITVSVVRFRPWAPHYLKIYQLEDAAKPPAMKFVNASGIPSNFVYPNDYSFWNLLNEVIQEEPAAGSDPTTLGLFASIGIEKGKLFNPDERMKKILTDAANIGAVTARTIAFKIRNLELVSAKERQSPLTVRIEVAFLAAPGVSNLDGAERNGLYFKKLFSSRALADNREHLRTDVGGGSGIRTHVTVSRKHAFQACAFSHSATPPVSSLRTPF